mgnify:FL=1|jgi:hypothetical protein
MLALRLTLHPMPSDTKRILFVEGHETGAAEMMQMAHRIGAISTDEGGNEIFWIMYCAQRDRVYGYTEEELRAAMQRRIAYRLADARRRRRPYRNPRLAFIG